MATTADLTLRPTPMRSGPDYWVSGYASMLRFDYTRMRQWLGVFVAVQLLMGAGMTVMYGFFLPVVPDVVALYITTGVPTLALIPIGFVFVPQSIAQQRLEGSYDYLWSLPVPKMVVAASTFTLLTLLALPGVVVALWAGVLRYGVTLDVQPTIAPALLLTSLMAASVGYAMGHAIPNAQLTNLIANLIVFFVLLFAPIAFPASQFPTWLQTVNAWLPFEHMATVVRASLAPQLVPGSVVSDYLIVIAWTVGGWLVAAWVVGRRH
jgi:ABC-2 type transport system permease protein